jgi:hypothetical protein
MGNRKEEAREFIIEREREREQSRAEQSRARWGPT